MVKNHWYDKNSPENIRVRTICEQNDIALLDHAISTALVDDLTEFFRRLRSIAIDEGANDILYALAARGVDFQRLTWEYDYHDSKPSFSTLHVLLELGWDINHQEVDRFGAVTEPFMWKWWCVQDYDLILWCLKHGASVHPRIPQSYRWRAPPPILEKVAYSGSIATFELLRSAGAPLGWRTLHMAIRQTTFGHDGAPEVVEGTDQEKQEKLQTALTKNAGQDAEKFSGKDTATHPRCETEKHTEKDVAGGIKDQNQVDKEGEQQRTIRFEKFAEYKRCIAMVEYLLDTVKMDVNGSDQPLVIPRVKGQYWGTPICYAASSECIPCHGRSEQNTRELTWLLLDHGADPTPMLGAGYPNRYPEHWHNEFDPFPDHVKSWRKQRCMDRKFRNCCVQ